MKFLLLTLLAVCGAVYGRSLVRNPCHTVGFFQLTSNSPAFYACYAKEDGSFSVKYMSCKLGFVFNEDVGYCMPRVNKNEADETVEEGSGSSDEMTETPEIEPTTEPEHPETSVVPEVEPTEAPEEPETTQLPEVDPTEEPEDPETTESPEVDPTEEPEDPETTEAPEVEPTEAPEDPETTEAPEIEPTEAPEVEPTEAPELDEVPEDSENTETPEVEPTEEPEDTETTEAPEVEPTEATEDAETTEAPEVKPTEAPEEQETTEAPEVEPTKEPEDPESTEVPEVKPTEAPEDPETTEAPEVPTEIPEDPKTTEAPKGEPTNEPENPETSEAPEKPETTEAPQTEPAETPEEPKTTNEPETTEKPLPCPNEGFHPTDGNCDKFSYCTMREGQLVAFELSCPEGQKFNPNSRFCEQDYICPNHAPLRHFRKIYQKFECIVEGKFAHHRDCSVYFACEWNPSMNTFQNTPIRCPTGEVFHMLTGECGREEHRTCLGRPKNSKFARRH